MKSENQIVAKLEELVDKFTSELEALPKDAKEADITREQTASIAVGFGYIMLLGWILDQEEEIQQVLRMVKIAGIGNKLAELSK